MIRQADAYRSPDKSLSPCLVDTIALNKPFRCHPVRDASRKLEGLLGFRATFCGPGMAMFLRVESIVIPAQAGIQIRDALDPRLREDDRYYGCTMPLSVVGISPYSCCSVTNANRNWCSSVSIIAASSVLRLPFVLSCKTWSMSIA
jgi:hypothetical protein